MNEREIAEKNYMAATGMITDLCKGYYGATWKVTFEKAMEEFDEIIEALMIYMAWEDQEISQEELDFIREYCIYGRLVRKINALLKNKIKDFQPIHYEDLPSLEGELRMKFERAMDSVLSASCQGFVDKFGRMDFDISTKNYFKEIKNYMLTILAAFSTIDIDPNSDEANRKFNAATDEFFSNFEVLWNSYNPNRLRPEFWDE